MELLLRTLLDLAENEQIAIGDAVDPYFAQFLHALVQEKEAQAGHNQPRS